MKKLVIGIDEVGRGALAGPLTLALVAGQRKYLKNILKGVRDSKHLSPKARENWHNKLKTQNSKLKTFTSSVNNKIIDKFGLTKATKIAITRLLRRAKIRPKALICLDGGLKAPVKYSLQKTIIKGDEKIPIIAAASIVAKVTRDRKMKRLSKKFPKYGFEIHKAYGTKFHYKKIRKFGICKIHRKSFLSSSKRGAARKIEE